MTIPDKWQVFDKPVLLDSKDEQRLGVYLTGWMHLSDLLKTIHESDLMRLVILELAGRQRWKVLDRLLMRLGRVQRKRVQQRVARCLRKRN